MSKDKVMPLREKRKGAGEHMSGKSEAPPDTPCPLRYQLCPFLYPDFISGHSKSPS